MQELRKLLPIYICSSLIFFVPLFIAEYVGSQECVAISLTELFLLRVWTTRFLIEQIAILTFTFVLCKYIPNNEDTTSRSAAGNKGLLWSFGIIVSVSIASYFKMCYPESILYLCAVIASIICLVGAFWQLFKMIKFYKLDEN